MPLPTRPDFVFEVLGDKKPTIFLEMYNFSRGFDARYERYLLIASLGYHKTVGISFRVDDSDPAHIFRLNLAGNFYDDIQSKLRSLSLPLGGYVGCFTGGGRGYFFANLLTFDLKLSWTNWNMEYLSLIDPEVRVISDFIEKDGEKFLWSEEQGLHSPS